MSIIPSITGSPATAGVGVLSFGFVFMVNLAVMIAFGTGSTGCACGLRSSVPTETSVDRARVVALCIESRPTCMGRFGTSDSAGDSLLVSERSAERMLRTICGTFWPMLVDVPQKVPHLSYRTVSEDVGE